MRRLFLGLVVAAATVLAPTWALAGNQEVAETIAANLRESGQLQGFKIGVKYQDGTAWLRGDVANQEQMNAALQLVFQTPGVTRVVNNLTVADQVTAEAAAPAAPQSSSALGRVQSAVTQGLGKLQQSAGAVAPERQGRIAPDSSFVQDQHTAHRIQSAATSPFPLAATAEPSRADRVPTSFSQGAVQPVAATTMQTPTLAPPQQTSSVAARSQRPIPVAYAQPLAADVAPGIPAPAAPVAGMPMEGVPMPGAMAPGVQMQSGPMPMYGAPVPAAAMPTTCYDQPHMPSYAWPGYAAYPNYAGVTYPKQYSPTAWPYIGPFYPYPQVPLGWRKVCLEWHDGWWFLDFDDGASHGWFSGLFRHSK